MTPLAAAEFSATDTVWRLTGLELFDLSGPVAIGADVSGRIGAPVIRGVLQANGARIESANTGTVLTNVQATGRFGGSRLQIDRFAADAGKGGRVTGSGGFDFAAAHGIGLDLKLRADHAVMINRDDIGATVTGPLTFTSDGAGGTIPARASHAAHVATLRYESAKVVTTRELLAGLAAPGAAAA